MTDLALKRLIEAILEGEEDLAAQATVESLADGTTAEEILNTVSDAGNKLGRMFETGECYLPELFAGAEAMNAAVQTVLPELEKASVQPKGTVVIGAVEGDVHEIGKRIVSAMLSGAGFRVHDLGVDVTGEQFVAKVRELQPDVIAASAYITTTCQRLPEIAAALEEAGLRKKVQYLIGGASVNTGMLAWAGADGFGENAAQAVSVVRSLVANLKGGQP
jgi:5-methyltetrahydrofolate--homocysteine methyltransferase